MVFEDLNEKQNSIYSKFKDTSKLAAEGLKPNIPQNQGGYLIAYRHPSNITDRLGEFSHQVSKIVPSLVYDGVNAHTTVSDLYVVDNFRPHPSGLDSLSKLVHSCLPFIEGVSINYSGWLLNQNTGIAEGYPNEIFWQNASRIVDSSIIEEILLKLPWGAHITTNRFLQTCSQDEVKEIIDLFKNAKPLGESKPEYIDVGHFNFSPSGFLYKTHERFKI